MHNGKDQNEQIQLLENQKKRLIQEQKAQERKDRTKRLCKRVGLLESMLPDTIPLSDEQFKTFMEKNHAHRLYPPHTGRINGPERRRSRATDRRNGGAGIFAH